MTTYKDESGKDMPPCKFHFDGEGIFDGFAHGNFWNGFDNVAVTKETLDEIIQYFYDEGDDEETLNDFRELEPMQNGLYSLGWFSSTTIIHNMEQFAAQYARRVGRA